MRHSFIKTAGACPQTGLLLLLLVALVSFVLPGQVPAKTVVDQLDRRVVVPDKPLRVISLAPSITEILFALEQEDRLMGATRFSDYPEQAKGLPKVGSYVNLDLEKIVSLKPDLCIAVKDGNPIEIVRRLELMGIPVYAVDPRNLDTVVETVLEIGHLLDADTIAEKVARDMVTRIRNIKTKVARIGHHPGVFFQIGISPIVSVGANTFSDELVQLAGGRNLAKGASAYPRFSKEQVLALAPEVIIICSMARQGGFDRMKAEWNRWPSLPAVKNRQIFLVDSNLFNRPTPRLVDGLELLFQLIHPEFVEEK
jgi:iron complex transport system substrate-binding protein